jgi:cellulose synthase/poly-beta-1,6-N-acetylglucosamine synthase-like glycosyltransferase
MSEFATNLGATAGLLLFFTWIGYPVLMEVVARLIPRRRSGAGAPHYPSVSIVIATRGPLELVQRRISNLLETTYPSERYEIVVGLDASLGHELDLLTADATSSVKVVRAAGSAGKPNALNAAVMASTGEILVLADSAQLFEREAVLELVRGFDDPQIGAVSGQLALSPALSRRLIGWYWRMERRLRANEARIQSAVGVTGAIYAIRRELFSPLPPGILLDDLYVPMRVVLDGFRVGFTDRARATDARTFSAVGEQRRKERTLAGVIQLCSQLPSVLNPVRNPIWFQFVIHKLMRLASPILLLATLPGLWFGVTRLDAMLPAMFARALWLGIAGTLAFLLLVPQGRSIVGEFVGLNWAVVRAINRGIRRDWDFW